MQPGVEHMRLRHLGRGRECTLATVERIVDQARQLARGLVIAGQSIRTEVFPATSSDLALQRPSRRRYAFNGPISASGIGRIPHAPGAQPWPFASGAKKPPSTSRNAMKRNIA